MKQGPQARTNQGPPVGINVTAVHHGVGEFSRVGLEQLETVCGRVICAYQMKRNVFCVIQHGHIRP